jgi:hypothetical protein
MITIRTYIGFCLNTEDEEDRGTSDANELLTTQQRLHLSIDQVRLLTENNSDTGKVI